MSAHCVCTVLLSTSSSYLSFSPSSTHHPPIPTLLLFSFVLSTTHTQRESTNKEFQSLPLCALFHFFLGLVFFALSFSSLPLSLSLLCGLSMKVISWFCVHAESSLFVFVFVCFCHFCFFSKVGHLPGGSIDKELSPPPLSNVHVCLLLVAFPLSFPN